MLGLLFFIGSPLMAQEITDIEPVYPPGQTAAKPGDYVIIRARVFPTSGVDSVWVDAQSIGGPAASRVRMYDDGNHSDGLAGDGIWGSDSILVDSVGTAYHVVTVYARILPNPPVSNRGQVGVDAQRPFISNIQVLYPAGQDAAKEGDAVRITAYISDVKGNVDILLAMDNSGSMADTAPGDTISKLQAAQNAADTFLTKLDAEDRAALYHFVPPPFPGQTSQETLCVPLTTNKQLVMDSVNALQANSYTPLYDMIYESYLYIRSSPNIPAVIVLSDGADWGPGGYQTGSDEYTRQDCYFLPVPVFTIAFGDTSIPPTSGGVDVAFLDSVATTSAGGKYFYAPTSAQLDSIYREIANIIASWEAPKGIQEAWVDATPFGGPSKVLMYDDGNHGDGAAGDTVYGSGWIKVLSNITDTVKPFVYALDVAHNQREDTTSLLLDNAPPFVFDSLNIFYADGNIAHKGEKIYFSIGVRDTGKISGIKEVYLDATQIGGPSNLPLRDDGTGNDSVAGDGIFTSDSIVVNVDSLSGEVPVSAYIKDISGHILKNGRSVIIDNLPPEVSQLKVQYPPGQSAAKVGDQILIKVMVTDNPAGVDTVYLNSLNIDGQNHIMVDDGTNGDEIPGDNIYSYRVTVTNNITDTVTFTVRALDREGNLSIPITGSVIIDNTPPTILSVTVSDSDNIYYNGETVNLLVTADAAGYEIHTDFSSMDDKYIYGSESVRDNGNGTYSVRYTISENNTRPSGTYTITVIATDGVGLSDTGYIDLVLDNAGPVTYGVDLVIDPLNDNIINAPDTVLAIIKDSNGVVEAEYFVDVIGPSGDGIPMTVNPPGADSVIAKAFLDTAGLAQGQHTVYVHGKDSSGVWGSYASMDFVFDSKPPTIENITIYYPEGQNSVRDGQQIKVTALIKDVTTSVDPSSVTIDARYLNGDSLYPMYDDGTNGDEFAGDNIYTAVITINTGLNGPQPFTITASDIVPNTAISDTGYIMLDNTAPQVISITVQDPDNIYRNGETVNLLVQTDAPGYRVSADFFPIDINYVDGAENVQDNNDGTYAVTYTISNTNTRPNGTYTIPVVVTDGVGLSDTGYIDLVLDNSGPVILSISLDDPDDTLNTDDTLRVVAFDDKGVVGMEYFVDNTSDPGQGVAFSSGNWGNDTVSAKIFFPISGLSEGWHTIYVHAQDSAGAWGGYGELKFLKDTKPPLIQNVKVKYPDGQEAVARGQSIVITALIRDVTTSVDPDSVYIDVSSFSTQNRVMMRDDGNAPDEVAGDNVYTAEVEVTTDSSGTFSFIIHASDVVPNSITRTGNVIIDNGAPYIDIAIRPIPTINDKQGEVFTDRVLVKGKYIDLPDSSIEGIKKIIVDVRDENGGHVNTSPIEIPVEDGEFSREIILIEGRNIIKVYVKDRAGLTTYDSAVVDYVLPEVSKEIGPEGGVIESPDGTKLIIPEGALNTRVRFYIKAISPENEPPTKFENISLLRVPHKFLPEGFVFLKPVKIILSYNDFDLDPDQDDTLEYNETDLVPYFFDGSMWLKAGEPEIDPDSNYVVFETNHLSIYDIAVEEKALISEIKVGWTRNPFRVGENSTFIFELPSSGRVSLRIVDLAGDVVRVLADNVYYPAGGRYNLQWDGMGDFNKGVRDMSHFSGSGIYIYIFEFEGDDGSKTVIRKPIGVIK